MSTHLNNNEINDELENMDDVDRTEYLYNVEEEETEEEEEDTEKEKWRPTIEKKKKKEKKENRTTDHAGKHFVIQKGQAQCDKGDQFPQFKVTSHNHHYWNKNDGGADYLAVTKDDTLFNPAGPSFGKCKLKPSSGGYLPCVCAPSGKWQKTYAQTKVMDKACVTEISELMCSVGGKITVKKHGQSSAVSKKNIKEANVHVHTELNPLLDIEAFQDDVEESDTICE
jgi:Domain of unknown function (DUF4280)